ncbi:cupredoxin family protein [Candidimonas humi]|jgi:uncharacterized cupredoxin-like copper-binding protein|uniref:Plastocyanin/azurin family copper-binding protein n=1 Tax=Candidimonas humi TaxID=683355 RepID=A0ABV8P552_9BURK|nr:cupredoxin family protein [Candidimonas humi]MBV6306921.1 cupredoxin family protein [Candidimonas humi]
MQKTLSIRTLAALSLLLLAGAAQAAGGAAHEAGPAAKPGMHEHAHESGAGRPGDPARADRTIDIAMRDSMRFVPSSLSVRPGETVRLHVVNEGKLRHELVLGSMHELQEHAAMMRSMPGMKHEEPNALSLAPGKQGDLVWQFGKAGTVDFACLEPGHMEAGMKGAISVR